MKKGFNPMPLEQIGTERKNAAGTGAESHGIAPEHWDLSFVISERRRAQDAARPGHVYFVSFGADGPIKIGFTANLDYRKEHLQTGCPYELDWLCVIAGGLGLERDLHDKFRAHRLRGEWFHRHPDILAEIEQRKQTAQSVTLVAQSEAQSG